MESGTPGASSIPIDRWICSAAPSGVIRPPVLKPSGVKRRAGSFGVMSSSNVLILGIVAIKGMAHAARETTSSSEPSFGGR